MNKYLTAAFLSASMLGLGGCGGGDDDPASPAPAAQTPEPSASEPTTPEPVVLNPARGVWMGTAGDPAKPVYLTALVFGDGTHYVVYTAPGEPEVMAGILMGKEAVAKDGTFSTSDSRDFRLSVACGCTPESADTNMKPVSIEGVYEAGKTLGGKLTFAAGALDFSALYSDYYEQAPALSTIAGAYGAKMVPGEKKALEEGLLQISAEGAVSASAGACQISGTVKPRTEGNAYDASLKFGPACHFAGQELSGAAYFDPRFNSIYFVAPNGERTDAAVFMGVKMPAQ